MTDRNLSPTRWLKLFAALARWSLIVLAVLWVVALAAWGTLHAIIVPRIGEFRPQLEAMATQAIGSPVKVAALSARSEGFIPTLELQGVDVLDAQGQVVLHLAKLVATLSPRSLMRLGFAQIYIDQPQLQMRRAADGRITVAGISIESNDSKDSKATDWLFEQREVIIHQGTLEWVDDLRQAPPLILSQVNLALRKQPWHHALRLDATPPAALGERFTLVGQFREPLLSTHAGRWQQWKGQIYAHVPSLNLAAWAPYLDGPADILLTAQGSSNQSGEPQPAQGHGSLRAWIDIDQAKVAEVTADVALRDVQAQLRDDLPLLQLQSLNGRISGRWNAPYLEASTTGMQWTVANIPADTAASKTTAQKTSLPEADNTPQNFSIGPIKANYTAAEGRRLAQGQIDAQRIDLAALSALAERLPLGEDTLAQLQRLAPQGTLEQITAQWTGPLGQLQSYNARGQLQNLSIGIADKSNSNKAESPVGIAGAAINFDMNQAGGQASIAVQKGQLAFPEIFEEPSIELTRLNGNVRWAVQGKHLSVQTDEVQFENTDASGTMRLGWHTLGAPPSDTLAVWAGNQSRAAVALPKARPGVQPGLLRNKKTPSSTATAAPPAAPSGADETAALYPGVLTLTGNLTRADGARVHRYLPLEIPADARHYVRDAVRAGTSIRTDFHIQGDLHHFPFSNPEQGKFYIAAQLKDVKYDYAPLHLMDHGALPWPVLTNLSGELIFSGAGMQVKNAKSQFIGYPGLQATQIEAQIADLEHPTVLVQASANGPLKQMLQVVDQSPVRGFTSEALAQASVTGNAQLSLGLNLPLHDLEHSKVTGGVTLAGNDVRLTPDTPQMSKARGTVRFSESGFSVAGVQAQALGGDLRMDGGMQPGSTANAPPTILVRAVGTASAVGLQQAKELGILAQIAERASGAAPYALSLAFRKGQPEVKVTSSLQGLAINLPAPLGKAATTSLPLRFETQLTRETVASTQADAALRDDWMLDIGNQGRIIYQRELGKDDAKVLRGSIAWGPNVREPAAMPASGVAATVQLDELELDPWLAVLNSNAPSAAAGASTAATSSSASGYLPSQINLKLRELKAQGRTLHDLNVQATQQGPRWQAQVDARELSGLVAYQRPTVPQLPGGQIFARLSRMHIPESSDTPFDSLLDNDDASRTLPALDVVVDDLQIHDRRWGRVEVEARNRDGSAAQRIWQLNKFNITTPEAALTATGEWSGSSHPLRSAAQNGRKKTALNFQLQINDSGKLLERFGMPGVLRDGKGTLNGQLAWNGPPMAPDYRSMAGQVHLEMASGQFLKAEPGLAKLLSVLSLQALPRRLTLDFRDVFSEGFAFDFVRGDMHIDQGTATTNNMQMKGVNAAVLMEGSADILHETQNLHVVVVPEINAMTASLVATAINPVIGLGSFLAQVFLRGPLIAAATQEFRIDGTWSNPQVQRVARNAADKTPAASSKPAP